MQAATIVSLAWALVGIYLLIGVAFAISFLRKGVAQLDEAAVEGSRWFKILITPGTVILWPLLRKTSRHKST